MVVPSRCVCCFNPRPPRRTGATLSSLPRSSFSTGFNPRPPRRTGATFRNGAPPRNRRVSILARPGGRALPLARFARACPDMFQSSPAPEDGRYRPRRQHVRHTPQVSILARPGGRALRRSGTRSRTVWGFNPRPPRRTGATRSIIGPPCSQLSVSILARPGGRALHHLHRIDDQDKMFQSSPAPEDGRYRTAASL